MYFFSIVCFFRLIIFQCRHDGLDLEQGKEFSSSQMARLGVCSPPAGGFLKRFATHCTNLLVARIVTTATARISPPVSVEISLLEPAPVDVLPINPNLLFTNQVGSNSLGSAHDKPTQDYIPSQQNIRQPQMNYIAPVLHSAVL